MTVIYYVKLIKYLEVLLGHKVTFSMKQIISSNFDELVAFFLSLGYLAILCSFMAISLPKIKIFVKKKLKQSKENQRRIFKKYITVFHQVNF